MSSVDVVSNKPSCPEHPESPVHHARLVGTDERRWFCDACTQDLGSGGVIAPGEWEPMTVTPKDVGDLKDIL